MLAHRLTDYFHHCHHTFGSVSRLQSVDRTPIEPAVKSGDPEEVNELLDDLEERSVDEQLRLFQDTFETLLSCLDHDDGYSRQAVVRIVSTLDPATNRMVVAGGADSRHDPGDNRFDEAVERASTLYAAALQDDDGRVRQAAIRGINNHCVGCRMTGDRPDIERLVADLEAVRERVDGDRLEHVEEALESARRNRQPL